ncbi:MAG: ABC transporter ATP-binding protein [Desulfobacterium sp.]|nr:ABC transporter ATP-binding protein [Desulfobacterium sp.]MBU3947062.1 ABC transporter ATP-binding protein/permease [Pseudomonadota bacterium]MBU4036344.1 ABC transporter ATP-binding protein/permease [Pseudomonadota bacterium]
MSTKKIKSSFFKPRHIEIIKLVKESWVTLFLAVLCLLVVAGSTAVSAYLIKPALDDVFINKDTRMLKLIPLAVIFIYFARGLGMYGQEYLMSRVSQNIIRRLRNRLYDHIQDLSLSFFHKEKTGTLMSRVTNDVTVIKAMVSSLITTSVRDCFTLIGLLFVIFYQIWELALFAFLILPLAFYPIVSLGRKVRRVSTSCLEAIADMSSFLHETFSGNKIVKAFGMESYEKKRFYDKTLRLYRVEMKQVKASSLTSPIMEFLGGLGIAFVIWYGGSRVISGVYTTGTFVSFLAAVVMLYDPVKKLSKLNNQLQQGLAATDRIFDIIEKDSEIKEDENPVELKRGFHNVTFEDVSFKYKDFMVLKNINLKVNPGEIVALVGMSGGGKTSLVNLIPRFYDVSVGSLSIDGVDIRKTSISSLRDQIAIVTQEPILFNDTVRNNIAYGNWNASDKDIEMAARAAYAYDFIQGFPDKFNTMLGELGGRLSGGEKQRICIARALIKDAPILILDEATSSLDTEAERLVQKALENLMKGRTTFVIAHRLSTIAYANKIIVIVNGCIVEEGEHEELIAKKGEYYKLYQMQFGTGDTK